ncbi:MAG: glycosyltransferase family 4 protein [Acidiferrobacter sp.]
MSVPVLLHYPRIGTLPRIVVLISTRIVGGPAKGLLQVIPEIHKRGHFEVVLCTFANVGEKDSPFVLACRERGVRVAVLRQRFHWDPAPMVALRALLEPPGCLLQTHGYKEAVFGLALKRRMQRPWIAFLHGTTEENLKVRLYHRLNQALTAHADAIVSVSQELADRSIRPRHRRKLTIIENAVERVAPVIARTAGRLAEPLETHGWTIGCVGRLSHEKGQALLLTAAGRLKRQGARFSLVFAGDGPDRALLEAKAQAEGVGAHVRFLGHVRSMSEFYAQLDMLVLPSLKEGMPNVILEAMQWQLPIVSTSVGAVPEMLVHGVSALLVQPGDAQAIARAMFALISDHEKARRMGHKACTSLYPRFSPEKRVERFEMLYNRVLESV